MNVKNSAAVRKAVHGERQARQRVESAMFEVQMVKVWNQLTHTQPHTTLSTLTTLGSEQE